MKKIKNKMCMCVCVCERNTLFLNIYWIYCNIAVVHIFSLLSFVFIIFKLAEIEDILYLLLY